MRKGRGLQTGAVVCALAFLLCAAMVAFYLIAGYGAYLDSDMASELALARHLAGKGALVSTTWRYSTEVRVLSTQLVFTPLMALFPGDWRLVRTLGCLILLALLSASSYACARWMGARRRYALLFAGLTLCPCSTVYAQMIVIGAYYVPHAIFTNLLVGLYARWLRTRSRVNAALLLALAAVLGAQSIRYLLCAVLPLVAAGAWAYIFPGEERERLPRTGEDRGAAALALGTLLCGGAGLAIGGRVLGALFLLGGGYGGQRLTAITAEDVLGLAEDALMWLLRVGGYAEGRLLLSMRGALSACSVAVFALAALLLLRGVRRAKREEKRPERAGLLAALMAFVITLCSFVFLEGLFLNRYWIPVMTLGAPALAVALTLEENPALRRLAALFLACATLGMAAVQIRDSMASPERGAEDFAAAQALADSGLTLGYATFWNANVMTELTNGRVEVVAMRIAEDDAGRGTPVFDVWLEAEENLGKSAPQERVFLLLESAQRQALGDLLERCGAREEPFDGGLSLLVIDSQRAFLEAIARDEQP